MSFTVEITLCGLGVLVFDGQKRSATPENVRFLMLNALKEEHAHFPSCSLLLEDIRSPVGQPLGGGMSGHAHREHGERQASPSPPESSLSIAPDGSVIVSWKLVGKEIVVQAASERAKSEAVWNDDALALVPGERDPADSLDWIPDTVSDFGFKDIAKESDDLVAGPYTARIRLPKGKLTSRSLLLQDDGNPRSWRFGGREVGVLADYLVWTCSGVTSLALSGLQEEALLLDAELRQLRGLPQTIQLAFTNLPSFAVVGHFGKPAHMEMYKLASPNRSTRIALFDSAVPASGGITPNGACPPAVKTSGGGNG